jgi:leucyl-tRNA synthetase
MHKSQGNFVPLWKACEDFGADAVRCTILLAAEGMDDPDWRRDNARDMQNRLESFLHLVEEKTQSTQQNRNGHLEKWIIDRIQAKAKTISESIINLKTRTALAIAIYDIWNDLRWYERRATAPNSDTIKNYLSTWIRLLTPFAPHLAEECWKIMGQEGFASTAKWPEFNESAIDPHADELEELVKRVLNDTQEIIITTSITPKKIHYYTTAKWKWQVFKEAIQRAEKQPQTLDRLIRDMITATVTTQKDLPKYAAKIVKQVRTMPIDLRKRRITLGELNEQGALTEAKPFLARELKADIEVHSEDDTDLYDPKMRAKLAEPYRPAIFIE